MLPSQGTTDLPCSVRRALQTFAALSLVCCFAELVCRVHYHSGFPYVWPLMPYYPPFADFTVLEPRFAFFHTGIFFSAPGYPFPYPAPLGLALAALFRLPWPLGTFLTSILLGFALATAVFVRALRREGLSEVGIVAVICAFAVSFPLWFELEQANSEALVWLIGVLGLWAFLRDRPYAAAACLPGLLPALLTMAVLLAPETEVIARAVSIGGEIKCLALLTLFFLAARYPFVLNPVPPLDSINPPGDRSQAESNRFSFPSAGQPAAASVRLRRPLAENS